MKKNIVDESKEIDIVLQVLKNDSLPKLSHIDSIKFNCILEDVFGKNDISLIADDKIVKCLEESFNDLKLIKNDNQVSCIRGG